jgi:uncharacterized membrane protein
MKTTKVCCWIMIALAIAFTVYGFYANGSDEYFLIRKLLRKIPLIIALVGVSCMFYYFFSDVIFQRHRNKVIRSLAGTLILIALSAGIYLATHYHPKVVYMKEDVMYVKPIPNIK